MKCSQCQIEWTAPPEQCPKCKMAGITSSQPQPAPAITTMIPPTPPPVAGAVAPQVLPNPNNTSPEIALLQQAANYRMLTKPLRSSAIGSIIFGVINTGVGIHGVSDNPINIILVLLGLFLLVEGIWILVTPPSSAGLVVDGIALIMIGVWNLMVTAINLSAGAQGSRVFPVLGIFQIIWGIRRFKNASQLTELARFRPDTATVKKLDELVKMIQKTRKTTDGNIIEFDATTFSAQQKWKGQLGEEYATLICVTKSEILFLPRERFSIDPKDNKASAKVIKASLKLGELTVDAKVPVESYEKLIRWKAMFTVNV